MFWQREYVRENIALALPGTYKLDLPEFGLLGSLLIRVTGTIAAGYGLGGYDWRIVDKISKITVLLNGATIAKSLTGFEAQALAVHDQGVMPPSEWKNGALEMQSEYFLINFGRYLFDSEVGLDLAKFKNVELQIENTASAASYSDLTISILGFYQRDPLTPSFAGFMRSEEWRSWATAPDLTSYNDLPTEYPLRRIMVQAIPALPAAGGSGIEITGMHNLMDDISLSLDTGVIRVWKGGIDDLIRENYLDMGKPLISVGAAYRTAKHGINIGLGLVLGGATAQLTDTGAAPATLASLEADRNSSTQNPTSYELSQYLGFAFVGLAPFLTGLFRFDYDYNPMTWLDPNVRKTVKLDIHSRNHVDVTAGRAAIILDRFVRT